MHMRTLSALVVVVTCALSRPVLAEDAPPQETGAVTLTANASGPRASSSRSTQGAAGKLRILGGMHFGGGGEWNINTDGPGDISPSLKALVGLQGGVDYVLMRYFALGGELRLTWWKPESIVLAGNDIGRSLFVDIDVKPRGRYEFSSIPLEVYGTLPMGLSFAALNDDTNMNGGAGFNLGFGGGATYFFTSRIGINAEMLGVWHWFDGEVDGRGVGNVDTDNRTAQFYFFLNAVFAI